MDKNTLNIYECKICNKNYKTYKTLWKHNDKYHINEKIKNINTNKLKCKYCNNIYSRKDNLKRHENICKSNNEKDNKTLKSIIIKQQIEISKLQNKLEKSNYIDNITLNKLNKKLLNINNLINNSTINLHNTNNIQNNYNNYQIVGFSKEDIVDLLTMQEKKQIMNSRFSCLEKLIEIIHCGKYNQFKNIIITNMNNNYMYKYDDEKKQFVLSTKSSLLNSLIDYRVSDIEIIYNELVENNKLDDKTKNLIEKFINKINYNNEKYVDIDEKEYNTYKDYKINEIKIILYNNKDKITNDISLMLSTSINEIIDVNL